MKAFFSFMIRWVIPVLGLIALSLIIRPTGCGDAARALIAGR